jgi:hypothetical protein
MILDEVKTVGILGDRHRGKTNLAYSLLKNYRGNREIVLYAYPVKVINHRTNKPYRQIHTIGELETLSNCIVFMDEMQKHIKFYDKRTNEKLLMMLSTIAHANVTIIFTTCLSQFITKALDGFIDGFLYVQMQDLNQLKNGSKAKRRLQDFSTERVGSSGLRLAVGEYMQIVDGQEESNGLHTFKNQLIGKDWGSK